MTRLGVSLVCLVTAISCSALRGGSPSAETAAIVTDSTGAIVGSVRDRQDGRPLDAAGILLAATNRGAITDERGLFAVSDLPPDTYRISITSMCYGRADTTVAVGAGEAMRLDITLH